MSRPERTCLVCGEYVDDQPVTRRAGPGLAALRFTTRIELVHVSATGARIDRAHRAVLDAR